MAFRLHYATKCHFFYCSCSDLVRDQRGLSTWTAVIRRYPAVPCVCMAPKTETAFERSSPQTPYSMEDIPVPLFPAHIKQHSPEIKRMLKWGGAAITHKEGALESPNMEIIRATARQVAQAVHAAQPGPTATAPTATVIVHGAGSFGHPQAVQYGVAQGWSRDMEDTQAASAVRRGFALTRSSVLKLNSLVVDALVAEGLPAVGLSPFSSGWATCGRRVVQDGCAAVRACLDAGLLPVLHGDCVLDEELGCTILSGDTIMRRLAEVMGAQEVVFLTNVAGVFDRPPELPGASLLRHILVRPDASWEAQGAIMSSSALDATGGIAKKVEEAAVIAVLGVDVIIAKAGTEDGRLACLLGSKELQLRMGEPAACPSAQHRHEASCLGPPSVKSHVVAPCAQGVRHSAAVGLPGDASTLPGTESTQAGALDTTVWKGTIVRLSI